MFVNDTHKETFEARRAEHRRGGALQKICGARTRGGRLCHHAPLRGFRRCNRHGGPLAYKAVKERQLQALARGALTWEQFEVYERRRMVNRLQSQWKRNPWLPGRTIDLGEHEAAFQTQIQLAARITDIPPSLLDWLRWKYRRLQIDRHQNEKWLEVVRNELPKRLNAIASVRDKEIVDPHADSAHVLNGQWLVADLPTAASKRNLPNRPAKPRAAKAPQLPKVRRTSADYDADFRVNARFENRSLLAELFEHHPAPDQQEAILAALLARLASPDDTAAARQWQTIISAHQRRRLGHGSA